jgi:hypothetical protein
MDLSRTRVVLRERAVVDVLDLAVRFVVEHGALYAKTTLLATAPFFAASLVIGFYGGWLFGWLFSLFVAPLAGAPFTALASRLVFEDAVRPGDALRAAARQIPTLLVLRVIVFVGACVGLSLLILPGIWLLAAVLFAGEVVSLERASAIKALTRSARIVGRESGEGLIALVLLSLLHLVAVFAADIGGRSIVTLILSSRAPDPIWETGGSVLGMLGFWLFVPYAATARFLVYLDVRTRSEGWDIQTRFVALASRPEAMTRSAA